MTHREIALPDGTPLILADAAAEDDTYTLPASYAAGRSLIVRRVDVSGNRFTVLAPGSTVLDDTPGGSKTVDPHDEVTFVMGDHGFVSYGGKADVVGSIVSIDSDGSIVVNGIAVEVATDTETTAAIAGTAAAVTAASMQKSANLSDVTNAATARTNLSLGGAATLGVGTSSGTVAAGDDSRIAGAAQKSANLSDLGSASTARTNLSLGDAATKNTGTASGQLAAGDDSRITGAAQKSANLSDLASPTTARTNLSLGGAATLNVGTTTGTVAAGDDSRVVANVAAVAALPSTYLKGSIGIYRPVGWGTRGFSTAYAAAKAGSGLCRVGVAGDSVSQGYNASPPYTKAWPTLMKTAMQAVANNGGSGFLPASYSDRAITALASGFQAAIVATGTTWTTTGTWSVASQGIGMYNITTTVSGSTVTSPAMNGTSIDFYTIEGTTAATYTWAVDGGSTTTITPSASNVLVKHTITGLSAGTHTLTLTFTGASGTMFFCGARFYNATGVLVDNYSRYGASSANLIESYGLGWQGGSKQPCDLLFMSMGLNDVNGPVTGDTWAQNHRKYLDDVLDGTGQTAATDLVFVLQHVGKNDATNKLFQDYAARARGLAEAYGAILIDMWAIGRSSWNYWNTIGSRWGSASTLGISGTDNVHLSDAGQAAVWAQVLAVIPELTA